ncbi:MAG TPA: hypothetical protein VMH00_00600 [Candidatus Limnocylindrales bacterium]|nr:hypothetical protein [Candidatus Limnocylindrales bacterium]
MGLRKLVLGVASILLCAVATRAAREQCAANQTAAVECFVRNALATNLTTVRHGMTVSQFEAYGVAVSGILQTHHTYLVLVGLASAVADAMPPANADGTPNLSAQQTAISQIVSAAAQNHLVGAPAGTTLQDLEWFSSDIVAAMNDNEGYMELLTPGIGMRLIDSYLVTATSNGSVNWTDVNTRLSNAISSFLMAGTIKLPPGVSPAQLTSFVQDVAQAIQSYKSSTGRSHL